jgi:predicted HicB family RNase H-like nuclease
MARSKTAAAEIESLTVRFPKELLQALRESAKANDRSLNQEIVNVTRSRVQSYQTTKRDHDLVCSNTE